MLKTIKILISVMCHYSGLNALYHALRPRRGLIILAYHRVCRGGDDPLDLAVSPADFAIQMRHLATAWKPVNLESALAAETAASTPEPVLHAAPVAGSATTALAPARAASRAVINRVAITFDDGYADNYHEAFPVLRACGLPATIFLSTAAVERQQPLWFMRIAGAIARTSAAELDLIACGLGRWPLRRRRARRRAARAVTVALKERPEAERERLIAAVEEQLGAAPVPAMLTWPQIRLMRRHGITFGCHTLTHPILARLDQKHIHAEIAGAQALIAARLDAAVESFAYPNGGADDYDERVLRTLRACGFRAACTLLAGDNRRLDPLQLQRIGVDHRFTGWHGLFTRAVFCCEMSGLFDLLFLRKSAWRQGVGRRADRAAGVLSPAASNPPPSPRALPPAPVCGGTPSAASGGLANGWCHERPPRQAAPATSGLPGGTAQAGNRPVAPGLPGGTAQAGNRPDMAGLPGELAVAGNRPVAPGLPGETAQAGNRPASAGSPADKLDKWK